MAHLVNTLFLLVSLILTSPAFAAEVKEQIIEKNQWPEYVNGINISNLPQVQQVLSGFEENGRIKIIIRYPGGDDGIHWANQMYQWFIAFGVPGQYLSMEPGSGAPDQLLLVLINRGSAQK
jgi:hypothetical protein